jgi:hypothetical protein
MKQDGVNVRLMDTYRGVFHPKVVLLSSDLNLIWVGSNNLTRDGLLNNIEFAALIRARTLPIELVRWSKKVAQGSTVLTDSLLASYRAERVAFEKSQGRAKVTTFTWSRKKEPESATVTTTRRGDLIVEIMPEETRGGNQIQIPKEAARLFFGLSNIGEQRTISLQPLGSTEARQLVVTVFENNTIRLSISELEYGDRPCVIVFRKAGDETGTEVARGSLTVVCVAWDAQTGKMRAATIPDVIASNIEPAPPELLAGNGAMR